VSLPMPVLQPMRDENGFASCAEQQFSVQAPAGPGTEIGPGVPGVRLLAALGTIPVVPTRLAYEADLEAVPPTSAGPPRELSLGGSRAPPPWSPTLPLARGPAAQDSVTIRTGAFAPDACAPLPDPRIARGSSAVPASFIGRELVACVAATRDSGIDPDSLGGQPQTVTRLFADPPHSVRAADSRAAFPAAPWPSCGLPLGGHGTSPPTVPGRLETRNPAQGVPHAGVTCGEPCGMISIPQLPTPEAPGFGRVMIRDPRYEDRNVEVLAFYYPGAPAPCDRVCNVPFLSNFWPLGDEAFPLTATCPDGGMQTYRFNNSEAAFQALKFWQHGRLFETVDGDGALALRRRFAGREGYSYGGYEDRWRGMIAVLKQKFQTETRMALRLRETGGRIPPGT